MACIRYCNFGFKRLKHTKKTVWVHKTVLWLRNNSFEHLNNTLLTVGKSEKDQNLLWFTCFSDLVDDQICRFARFPFATSRSAKVIYKFFFLRLRNNFLNIQIIHCWLWENRKKIRIYYDLPAFLIWSTTKSTALPDFPLPLRDPPRSFTTTLAPLKIYGSFKQICSWLWENRKNIRIYYDLPAFLIWWTTKSAALPDFPFATSRSAKIIYKPRDIIFLNI